MKQLLPYINIISKPKTLLAALLLVSIAATAQKPIRSNVKVDVSIPIITGNYTLRKSFSEIIDINASYNKSLGKHLTLGPALGFTHFTVDSLTYERNRTRMFIITPAVDIGYQSFMSDNALFSANLQIGYAMNRFTNVFADSARTPTGYNFNTLSIEPMMRFYFFTSDRLALGFKVSYKMMFHTFDYKSVYFDHYNKFTDKQNSGNIQHLNFGVIVMLGTSKKDVKSQ